MGIYPLTDRIIDPTRYPWGVHQLWTPGFITTALWLDAADSSTITLVSGAVSQWADKSGNNRHATPPSTSARPSLLVDDLNGLDAIRFDGTSSVLHGDNGAGLDSFLFLVFKKIAHADYVRIFAMRDESGDALSLAIGQVEAASSTSNLLARTGDPNGRSLYYTVSNSEWHVFQGKHPNSGGGSEIFILNGSTPSTVGTSSHLTYGNVLASKYSIGARWDESFAQVDIAEVVVSPSSTTSDDRQKLEGYLAHKWGLTANLPSDHPYKDNAPRV